MTFGDMAGSNRDRAHGKRDWVAALYNPKVRGLLFQAALLLAVAAFLILIIYNTVSHLSAEDQRSGFGFLSDTAKFEILISPGTYLMGYEPNQSTYFDAFMVGIINTLAVSFLGVIAASVLGVILGLFRLSSNVALRGFAAAYVEALRNIPLLLFVFLMAALLNFLPSRSDPWTGFGGAATVDKTGFRAPFPVFGDGFEWVVWTFFLALAAAYGLGRWARARQEQTGETFPSFWAGAALTALAPLLVFVLMGSPIEWEHPVRTALGYKSGFGLVIRPEMVAIWLALSLYTAAFIAEIVRAGVLAVHRGQSEAAYALGMRPQATMRLIIAPQAMRVIVPPLASTYLNLTKNSSLAVAIGYTDLYALSKPINQSTGQEVEIVIIILAVYLTFSLLISLAMNLYNRRIALVER